MYEVFWVHLENHCILIYYLVPMNIEKTFSKLSGIIWRIGEDLHSFNGGLQDFAAILFSK